MSTNLKVDTYKTADEDLSDGCSNLSLNQKMGLERITENGKEMNYFLNGGSHSLEKGRDENQTRESLITSDINDLTYGENSLNFLHDKICLPSHEKNPTIGTQEAIEFSPENWQNFNSTIQLVAKTCEALWLELEEEKMKRDQLQIHLQEQRSVVSTLTSELLQVQEHQRAILKELQARSAPDTSLNRSGASVAQLPSRVGAIPNTNIQTLSNSTSESNINYTELNRKTSPRHQPNQHLPSEISHSSKQYPPLTNGTHKNHFPRVDQQNAYNSNHLNLQNHNSTQPNLHNLSHQPNLQGHNLKQPNLQNHHSNQPNLQALYSNHPNLPGHHSNQLNLQGLSGSRSQVESEQTYRDSIKERIHLNNNRMRHLREVSSTSIQN